MPAPGLATFEGGTSLMVSMLEPGGSGARGCLPKKNRLKKKRFIGVKPGMICSQYLYEEVG